MDVVARLKGVEKTYQVGEVQVRALRGVDLEIASGSFLSIAGPSGSGKTTLLNLLGALDTPSAGTIEVGGNLIGGMRPKELADFRNTHLGFVFQSFNLIPVLSVTENVMFPLHLYGVSDSAERRRRVQQALEDVGIGELATRLPAELSGGQQQRVAIARALVKDPSLVLADEPTANLDSDTSREIITLMRELNQRRGTTFVFSTHDPLVMEAARRLIMLRDGQVERDEQREEAPSHA